MKFFKFWNFQQPPFVERHETSNGIQYSGYCIDLINLIKNSLNFRFTIYEVPDKAYGTRNAQGEWNGLIKELVSAVSQTKIFFIFQKYCISKIFILNSFSGSWYRFGSLINFCGTRRFHRFYDSVLRSGRHNPFDAKTSSQIFVVQIYFCSGRKCLGRNHRRLFVHQRFALVFRHFQSVFLPE